MTAVEEILSRVRITEVYSALTGTKPRHSSNGIYRGPATWRGGDGYNVSMDDQRAVWHDYVTDDGGGMLDLVIRVRGGSRQDALRWLAEFVGLELEDGPLTQEDRTKWAEERKYIERYLPVAQLWRRTVVILTEEMLDRLKGALFDASLPWPEINEIYDTERLLKRLERLERIELIQEYNSWFAEYPGITEALVREARRREQAESHALRQFIKEMGSSDVCPEEPRY